MTEKSFHARRWLCRFPNVASRKNVVKKPRAKPRARRKEARPGEIIEAGLQEFAAHGFAGTRLDDVARRAGVVKGTIYRYFEDKEALFLAVVRSRVPAVLEPSDKLIDAFEGTTRELLTSLLGVMYGKLVDSEMSVLMRIIIAEGTKFPGLIDLYYRESISKGLPLLERAIARGVARGEVRAQRAPLLHMMLAAPVVMAAVWKMTFDAKKPIATKDFFEAHLDLLFNAPFAPRIS